MAGATFNNNTTTVHTPTDRTRWRLRVDDGRQTWHYLSEEEHKANPQTDIEKYWLGLKLVTSNYTTAASPPPPTLRPSVVYDLLTFLSIH